MKDFLQRLQEKPLIFDGAMGTMLYERGVFINTCYDELCLNRASLVHEIHEEYIRAGAEVIETNTFGANRIKLGGHGLVESVTAINTAAVACAKKAAGDSVYVAGSVGPCTKGFDSLPVSRYDAVRAAFNEQIGILVGAGVDCILLETFSKENELSLALDALEEHDPVPVIASFALLQEMTTAVGTRLETIVSMLEQRTTVDVIGINCGTGPSEAMTALERIIPLTTKPVIVMPNAGYPREVDGRLLYLANPEYFTEYARRFIKIGARGIGGCCGTTPAHIKAIADAIRTMDGVKSYIKINQAEEAAPDVVMVSPAKKSKFAAKMLFGKELVASVEILPPRSIDLTPLIAKAQICADAGVDAINIPDGPRASLRISPMIAAITISREVGIEPVLHYCCRDRNLIGMQADILGAYAAGIANFLIITGDPPKLGDYPDATGVFDIDAIGLTQAVSNLNRGIDIGGNRVTPPPGIFIGVGVNPCAIDFDHEMDRFRQKIDAGAEYAITQPVFDIAIFEKFMNKIKQFPKTIPIVAGIWPLISYRNAEFMNNEVPGVVVPQPIMERMSRKTQKDEAIEEGIAICQDLIEQIKPMVRGVQVSAPFGRVEIAIKVLRNILPA